MINAATKNLGMATAKGCADCKAIFVAAAADDQKIAKIIPAAIKR